MYYPELLSQVRLHFLPPFGNETAVMYRATPPSTPTNTKMMNFNEGVKYGSLFFSILFTKPLWILMLQTKTELKMYFKLEENNNS